MAGVSAREPASPSSPSSSLSLRGKTVLVTGATRGAGRAIALAFGEAGAVVYCSGRSVRGRSAMAGRPECIEDTAELVTEAGGRGVAVRVDHTIEAEVASLCAQIRAEAGGLDVLVDDVWGGEELMELGVPLAAISIDKGRTMLERAVVSHVITAKHAVPLLRARPRALLVEVTDGDTFGYRGALFYDLTKMAVIRLAFALSRELARTPVTALAVTPGFLRSEQMLAHFGVGEANWRDGAKKDPHFIASESPHYVARAIRALARIPRCTTAPGACSRRGTWPRSTASPTSTEAARTGAPTSQQPSAAPTGSPTRPRMPRGGTARRRSRDWSLRRGRARRRPPHPATRECPSADEIDFSSSCPAATTRDTGSASRASRSRAISSSMLGLFVVLFVRLAGGVLAHPKSLPIASASLGPAASSSCLKNTNASDQDWARTVSAQRARSAGP